MKKIGIYLVIIGITFFTFYFMYNKALDRQAQDNVDDYIKKSSIISYSKEALEKVHNDIELFAQKEGLTAHANSIRVRFE